MRHRMRTFAVAAATTVAIIGAGFTSPAAGANTATAGGAPIQPFLSATLAGLSATEKTTVMVHGTTITAAKAAVAATGMKPVTTFNKIGVAVARATATQVRSAAQQPAVTYLEGNQPIRLLLSTSNTATRGSAARAALGLDGRGVSVAVIDSGIDPTHPFFQTPNGTAVVRNLKSICPDELELEVATCVVDLPTFVDTDTLSVGGHGTHVSGIVAGRDTTLTDGTRLHGAAPGASLVSISTGAALFVLSADSALNWVLENHRAPCGAGISASACPPIKVVNNSYGAEGDDFDPNLATIKLQRALVAQGVVVVWANGNSGDVPGTNQSNPLGQDPTPGVISVASYNDLNTGTRNGTVSDFSSRGEQGRPSTYPDISAPGENIESSCRPYLIVCSTGGQPKNGPGILDIATFNTISGTSMAAPHISGIVAQLFQANAAASPAKVEDALKSSAYKYSFGAPYELAGAYTTSRDKGTGLADVVAAAQRLAAGASISSPTTTTAPVRLLGLLGL